MDDEEDDVLLSPPHSPTHTHLFIKRNAAASLYSNVLYITANPHVFHTQNTFNLYTVGSMYSVSMCVCVCALD